MSEGLVSSGQRLTGPNGERPFQDIIDHFGENLEHSESHQKRMAEDLRENPSSIFDSRSLQQSQYNEDLSAICTERLKEAERAWEGLGRPVELQESLNSCKQALQSIKDKTTDCFAASPLTWIPRSVATMLMTINGVTHAVKAITASTDEPHKQEIQSIYGTYCEVRDHTSNFRQAARVLGMCSPRTEDQQASSSCWNGWKRIVEVYEAGSDLSGTLDTLKRDLSGKFESAEEDWKKALFERLKVPQKKGEAYMSEAIRIGNKCVNGSRSASKDMSQEQWRKFEDMRTAWTNHYEKFPAERDNVLEHFRWLTPEDSEAGSKREELRTTLRKAKEAQGKWRELRDTRPGMQDWS